MGISDKIESFILELLKEENRLEIGRNELAAIFNCVPSQINYVISTRFSEQRGYTVESKRGGGGYLRITRIIAPGENTVYSIVRNIGLEIDYSDAKAILEHIEQSGKIDERTKNIMLAGISDKSLSASNERKNEIRASSLKNMLLAVALA